MKNVNCRMIVRYQAVVVIFVAFFSSTWSWGQSQMSSFTGFVPSSALVVSGVIETFDGNRKVREKIEHGSQKNIYNIFEFLKLKKSATKLISEYYKKILEQKNRIKAILYELVGSSLVLSHDSETSSEELENELILLLGSPPDVIIVEKKSSFSDTQEDGQLDLATGSFNADKFKAPKGVQTPGLESTTLPIQLIYSDNSQIENCQNVANDNETESEQDALSSYQSIERTELENAVQLYKESVCSLFKYPHAISPVYTSMPLPASKLFWRHSPYFGEDSQELVLQEEKPMDRIVVIGYDLCRYGAVQLQVYTGEYEVKLGGVLSELDPYRIATTIKAATGVEVKSVSVFPKKYGLCRLSLHSSEEAERVIKLINRRIWFGPFQAFYAKTEEASFVLMEYLNTIRTHLPRARFPRHLVTAEHWKDLIQQPESEILCQFGDDACELQHGSAPGSFVEESDDKQDESRSSDDTSQALSLSVLRQDHTARTLPMIVMPLDKAPDWFHGKRVVIFVGALEWELGRKNSKEMDFFEAKAYAMSRHEEGWRLPRIEELEALYHQKSLLGDDLSFDWFWSETPIEGQESEYWGMNFDKGFLYYNDEYHDLRVRLVRDYYPSQDK